MSTYLQHRQALKLGLKVSEKKELPPPKVESENDHPRLLKAAQQAFNMFIRIRDKKNGCICGCGGKVEQCGHFFPMTYSAVRFDEDNCHGISKDCNYFSNEAIDPNYKEGLIKKIGKQKFSWLAQRAKGTRKYSREELEALIKEYSYKSKAINKAALKN